MGSYYAGIMNNEYSRSLRHYRTVGSKNGIRLYQNEDGSLTDLGRQHYGVGEATGTTQSSTQSLIDKYKKSVHDKGTIQELEAIERKLKTGAMDENEAKGEIDTAVSLDTERYEAKKKKAEKEAEKKRKEAEREQKKREAEQKKAARAAELLRKQQGAAARKAILAKRANIIRMHVGSSGNRLSLARSGRR